MRAIEKLLRHISTTGNLTRRSIIGGDLNLLQADWVGDAGKESGVQASVNNLICDNGYTQVYANPPEGAHYWISVFSDRGLRSSRATYCQESAIIKGTIRSRVE